MREEPPNARGASVPPRRAQRMPAERGVGIVDGGAGCDEVVDHVESLVVRRHHQRPHPGIRRGILEPLTDVARCRRLLDAVDLRAGSDEHVHHLRLAEHRGVEERRALGTPP